MSTITLFNAQQGHTALSGLWQQVKPLLMSGKRLTLKVEEERRNVEQNKLLHALIGDIADRREWCGRKWDAEVWKRLLTAAWCRARGEQVAVVPALDGHGVDVVFRRTSTLTKAECAELIDFITAWDAQQ